MNGHRSISKEEVLKTFRELGLVQATCVPVVFSGSQGKATKKPPRARYAQVSLDVHTASTPGVWKAFSSVLFQVSLSCNF